MLRQNPARIAFWSDALVHSVGESQVGLYKIFVHFNAFVNEPIIILLPPSTCNAHTVAIVLHDCCARYAPPPTPLLYAAHYTILAMEILCKGQVAENERSAFKPLAVLGSQ